MKHGYEELRNDSSYSCGSQQIAPNRPNTIGASCSYSNNQIDSQPPDSLRVDLFSSPNAPESHEVHMVEPGAQTKGRWDHIDNLDQFFLRIYEYHQRGGFFCMMVSEIFELFQFVFIASLSSFMLECVNYDCLFKNRKPTNNPNATLAALAEKRTLKKCINQDCASHFHPILVICLIIASVFWAFRAIRVAYQLLQYWEIRNFYISALQISPTELDNMTWYEVLQKLCLAQREIRLCIHKQDLTELDIYQRILRHKNYLIAMVNKGVFPPRFDLPFLGTVGYFPLALKLNLEWILFWGPWSPWKDYFSLKPEFKRRENLKDLKAELEKVIFWMGIANLVLSPLVLLWQILYSFFSYAELIKREPGALGMRRWSVYGRYYFRHFNELDHELNMRLNRAYRPAAQYMDMFISKLSEIFAKNVAFVSGSFCAILSILIVWDEDVGEIEHVLTAAVCFAVVVYACKVFIPDENLVWCPEWLMNAVLAQVHYLPDNWKGHEHTDRVRHEFSQLFQFKAFFLFEELVSPLVTPFVLLCYVMPRAGEVVDFFHKFTLEVPGLGDVCSFAQMDIQKHGDPKWNGVGFDKTAEIDGGFQRPSRPRNVGKETDSKLRHGKTEMSLVHFTLTNPGWNPPPSSARFLINLRTQTTRDADVIREHQEVLVDNPLMQSLNSLGLQAPVPLQPPGVMQSMGGAAGVQFSRLGTGGLGTLGTSRWQSQMPSAPRLQGKGLRRTEGPLESSQAGILASLNLSGLFQNSAGSMGVSTAPGASHQAAGGLGGRPIPIAEGMATEMSINALYLHELHNRRLKGVNYGSMMMPQMMTPLSTNDESPVRGARDGRKFESKAGNEESINLWEVDEREEPGLNLGRMEIMGQSEDGESVQGGGEGGEMPPQIFDSTR